MPSTPNHKRVESKINLPKKRLRIISMGNKHPDWPVNTKFDAGIKTSPNVKALLTGVYLMV